MDTFEVGDLVRDKLNADDGSYGLGVIVAIEVDDVCVQDPDPVTIEPCESSLADTLWAQKAAKERFEERLKEAEPLPGTRYDVYFTKFERTITFHGDYLEKV
jgi:hypothetical protein